ncbi:MAG: hypothetical protein ACI8RA_000055 [Chlamydiales bacterium]|jgi:hypothetical protein
MTSFLSSLFTSNSSRFNKLLSNATLDTNVSEPSEAQVILLLETKKKRAHRIFHATVIEHLYNFRKGDIILLQDSSEKAPKSLDCSQIRYVTPSNLRIAGWESVIVSPLRDSLFRINERTKSAIQGILHTHESFTPEHSLANFRHLSAASETLGHKAPFSTEEYVRIVYNSSPSDKNVEKKIKRLSYMGTLLIKRNKEKYQMLTFPILQDSLIQGIKKQADRRRIFVIANSSHFKLTEAPNPEYVQKLQDYLGTTKYLVLDPERIDKICSEMAR